MDITSQPSADCRSFFKNGRLPTVEEYTRVWIKLINEIEKRKYVGGLRKNDQ